VSDIRAIFRDQATACAALGSPFMERLMGLFADRLTPGTPVSDHLFNWPGDPSIHKDNAPLRLAGALHALKLRGRALGDVYPPLAVSDDALWTAVQHVIETHEDWVMAWLANPPQTNEVRRAAAIMPALAMIAARYRLPVELLELGASGGLNLRADLFHLATPSGGIGPRDSQVQLSPEWRGSPPKDLRLPHIVRRAGVDLAPLDPSRPENQLRLLSYLWADQQDRMERTRSAIEIATAFPVELAAEDAGTWLTRQLARPSDGLLRVVFHTVAWQYFPQETAQKASVAMAAHDGPLVEFAMEADGGNGAALTLTTYPIDSVELLGRVDFHGRWIDWRPQS
jgi:hypothetical protein